MTNMKIDDKTSHNSPSIRFPEFTGEWKKCKIEDITDAVSSGKSKNHFSNGEYNLYGSTGIIGRTDKALYDGKLVLVARVGANAGFLQIINEPCGITDNTLILKPKGIDAFYLYYFLQHFNLNRLIFGSGQPLITGGMLKKVKVSLGTISEQSKIVKFLSLLDERIATQVRLIDRLQSLMIGIRHRIINEAKGKIVCLCEVSDIYQPQTISSADLTETGYPVYGANGIIGHYTSYNHEAEQVCITCRGNTCGGVNYTKSKSWITGNAMVVNVDRYQNIVSKRYLYHYLSNCDFNSIISGSGQPQIVRAPLAKFKIILPTVMQQYKIAHCLDVIQNKINVNSNILNLLIRQKQYLLRKMFI